MIFKHKNLSFYYEMYGNSNKTILILPGWGDTRKTFSNIIYSFKDQYTVYILDYPGFGNSPFPKHDLTLSFQRYEDDGINRVRDIFVEEVLNKL